MQSVLPPRLSRASLDSALSAFEGVVGKDWVLTGDDDRDAYLDAYAPGDGSDHVPSAIVAPKSAEEVQAILRIANERRVPVWPVSRGKNLGYGYAAPLVSGSVVMDMRRMNRILDVDTKHAYCVVEPGVGFYDLYEHLDAHKIPLWMSIPGNAWGSVLGNALERGLGYTPYGDNAAQLCGMEVALADGSLVRTGLGAMSGSKGWQHYQNGFGPGWDQAFVQSNFGVVTKAGLWLMPEPEATLTAKVTLNHPDDIGWAIDELAQLRMRGVIDHSFVFGNYLHDAAVLAQRSDWYTGKGSLPDEVAQKIVDHYGSGWWSFTLNLYGYPEVIAASAKVVNRALEPRLGEELKWTPWAKGQPYAASPRPSPSVLALQVVNWRGGRGGHIGFSPVMPPDGKLALEQFKRMKARFEEFGLDYYASFTMGRRHINNINMIIYDRDDPQMTSAARGLFKTLMADSKAQGYGEYRTHLSFMDAVAGTYDWGGGALTRLNERVKDAVDPNGILAPGKNGVWPAAYRGSRA
jgi:4-cresol dehydrogenase (hydroxylating)